MRLSPEPTGPAPGTVPRRAAARGPARAGRRSTRAFLEEDRHASLTDPQDPSEVVWRDGVPALRRYWEHVDFDRDAGTGPGVS